MKKIYKNQNKALTSWCINNLSQYFLLMNYYLTSDTIYTTFFLYSVVNTIYKFEPFYIKMKREKKNLGWNDETNISILY